MKEGDISTNFSKIRFCLRTISDLSLSSHWSGTNVSSWIRFCLRAIDLSLSIISSQEIWKTKTLSNMSDNALPGQLQIGFLVLHHIPWSVIMSILEESSWFLSDLSVSSMMTLSHIVLRKSIPVNLKSFWESVGVYAFHFVWSLYFIYRIGRSSSTRCEIVQSSLIYCNIEIKTYNAIVFMHCHCLSMKALSLI